MEDNDCFNDIDGMEDTLELSPEPFDYINYMRMEISDMEEKCQQLQRESIIIHTH